MGRAHGGGVADDGQVGVKGLDGDLERRAGLRRQHVIAFAVYQHIVILAAAPDDRGGGRAVLHGQGAGRKDLRLAGAARECELGRVDAVGQAEVLNGLPGFRSGNGVGDGDLMVVPDALFADEGDVKLRIQRGDGDVEAVDLVGQAVGIGDGVGRGLQELRAVLLRILGQTIEQVDDALGREADMDGHAAVLDGQRALAVTGLVRVEHAAVGVEFSGIDAVGQGGLGGSRFFRGLLGRLGCGSFFVRGGFCRGFGGGLRRLCGGRLGLFLCAAGQQGKQQQRRQGKCDQLFHWDLLHRAQFAPGRPLPPRSRVIRIFMRSARRSQPWCGQRRAPGHRRSRRGRGSGSRR